MCDAYHKAETVKKHRRNDEKNGKSYCNSKSKGWRGEDNHNAQFGRCAGCCGQERAADRSGQSGQPDDQRRHGAAGGSEDDCRRSEERRRADPRVRTENQ